METIKINLRPPERTVGSTVRITPDARLVLQEILDNHNVSATQVVSQLIIQGASLLEFVQTEE